MQNNSQKFDIKIDKNYLFDFLKEYELIYKERHGTYGVYAQRECFAILSDDFRDKKYTLLEDIPDNFVLYLNNETIDDFFSKLNFYSRTSIRYFLTTLKKKDGIDLFPHLLDYMLRVDDNYKKSNAAFLLEDLKDIYKKDLLSDEKVILNFLNFASQKKERFECYSCTFFMNMLLSKDFDIDKVLKPENSKVVVNYMNAYFKYNKAFPKIFINLLEKNKDKMRLIFGDEEMPQRLKSLYDNTPPMELITKDAGMKEIVGLSRGFKNAVARPNRVSKSLSKDEILSLVEKNTEVFYAKQVFDVSRYATENSKNINSIKYVLRHVFVRLDEDRKLKNPISVFEDKQNLQVCHFIFFNKEERDDFINKFHELSLFCLSSIDDKAKYGTIMNKVDESVDKFYRIVDLEKNLSSRDEKPIRNKTTKI